MTTRNRAAQLTAIVLAGSAIAFALGGVALGIMAVVQ
jgi:hypothetical protein